MGTRSSKTQANTMTKTLSASESKQVKETLWHTLALEQVAQTLETNIESGLSTSQVAQRQQQYGLNELIDYGGRSSLQILWEQLRSAMILLLVVAATISFFLHEYIDAGAILVIIILNAAIGFFQDFRAERALAALKQLAVPEVKVRRDGTLTTISAKELVPGDVISIEAGNLVPADCRILESMNLRIQESSLTGESEPIDKHIDAIPTENLPLGDRTNMAFMGTLTNYGHGLAIVTSTGMSTQLGLIASSLQTVEPEPTPLQDRLAQLGRTLALASLAIVAVVFVLGISFGESPKLMLMTALSLAVAIVPEGLPAVATVALAIGAQRMFRRHALIRKLPAVETLGSVTVICSDKTGTLTENRMTVTVLDVAGQRIDLTENIGHNSTASALAEHSNSPADGDLQQQSSITLMLASAALCNDAELVEAEDNSSFHAVGEPTEAALVVAAAQLGMEQSQLSSLLPRNAEVPFDSERKRMTTIHSLTSNVETQSNTEPILNKLFETVKSNSHIAFMKGAVDVVLQCCQSAWVNDAAQPLDDQLSQRIMAANDQLAANGMRVLGVAFRPLESAPQQDNLNGVEQQMIFIGLLGMIDPARPEVREAVERCKSAGIRPIMITGDHPLTAQHIANSLGITDDTEICVGNELAGMSALDIEPIVKQVPVYARVAPNDKLHIVQALQNQGQIVAMTGDGVNDAPALKQAHIGVAMGQVGTDVSKEASDMVLLDDNFATIVNAVEAGRIVYDNIRKFVKYTMTSNAGEVWVMLLGPIFGMPLALLPLQILWVNLVTDGLPGLALAMERAERNTMRRPPYPPNEHIMGQGMWREIAWVGLLMGIVSLAMGYWYWQAGASETHWRTIVFTVLTLSQMGNALATRSARDSLFQIGIFSNKTLIGSILLTFVLQLAVIYLAPLQKVFSTTALSLSELAICLLLSTIVFWAVETKKLIDRRLQPSA